MWVPLDFQEKGTHMPLRLSVLVPLNQDEFLALTHESAREMRMPRDHARYLLREALGLTGNEVQSKQTNNPTGKVSEAAPSRVA